MSDPKKRRGRIPIRAAEQLSKQYNLPATIVFGLEDMTGRFTITTYGATPKLCKWAADIGQQISEQILACKVTPAQIEPENLPEVPAEWDSANERNI